MEREDTPLFPVEALREALANAFVHRDYGIGGAVLMLPPYSRPRPIRNKAPGQPLQPVAA